MLEAALAAGIAQGGGDALIAGVLPTPGGLDPGPPPRPRPRRRRLRLAQPVARQRDQVLRPRRAQARRRDRGASRGAPLAGPDGAAPAAGRVGRVRSLEGALDDYLRELASTFSLDLSGTRVVLDCANGATYRAAPAIFGRLGAEVEAAAVEPDGRNINDGCGSTHPEALAERVAQAGADVGFAFDGDGDRVIAVDADGAIHDGDELLALAARTCRPRPARRRGRGHGDDQLRLPPGDGGGRDRDRDDRRRRSPRERGARAPGLGARRRAVRPHRSGPSYAPTGDGIAAALLTMRALGGRALAQVEPFRRLPQVLRNVEVADRAAIAGAAGLWNAVERERPRSRGAAGSSFGRRAPSRWSG